MQPGGLELGPLGGLNDVGTCDLVVPALLVLVKGDPDDAEEEDGEGHDEHQARLRNRDEVERLMEVDVRPTR